MFGPKRGGRLPAYSTRSARARSYAISSPLSSALRRSRSISAPRRLFSARRRSRAAASDFPQRSKRIAASACARHARVCAASALRCAEARRSKATRVGGMPTSGSALRGLPFVAPALTITGGRPAVGARVPAVRGRVLAIVASVGTRLDCHLRPVLCNPVSHGGAQITTGGRLVARLAARSRLSAARSCTSRSQRRASR
jgi:hypothetical protein